MNTHAVPDARLTDALEPPASGRIRVAVVIAPGAEVVDFAGPWGVFEYTTVDDVGQSPFELFTVAASPDPVVVSGGMTIQPSYDLPSAPHADIILVPAMTDDGVDPMLLSWLGSASDTATLTMSVCNGSFVLGAAGLLDGRKATAHHLGYTTLRARFPGVEVIRGARYVEDGPIATAGGLTSGTDLALRVVERFYGRPAAERTATQLEYQGTGWMFPNSNNTFAAPPAATTDHAICPVCEMEVPRTTKLTADYDGATWYFCGGWCRGEFLESPERYAHPVA